MGLSVSQHVFIGRLCGEPDKSIPWALALMFPEACHPHRISNRNFLFQSELIYIWIRKREGESNWVLLLWVTSIHLRVDNFSYRYLSVNSTSSPFFVFLLWLAWLWKKHMHIVKFKQWRSLFSPSRHSMSLYSFNNILHIIPKSLQENACAYTQTLCVCRQKSFSSKYILIYSLIWFIFVVIFWISFSMYLFNSFRYLLN